jgi:hypothetical protein
MVFMGDSKAHIPLLGQEARRGAGAGWRLLRRRIKRNLVELSKSTWGPMDHAAD